MVRRNAAGANLLCIASIAHREHAHYIDPMINFDFNRSFGFVLHETARLLSKRFDQRAKCLGLTRAQIQLMAYLVYHEGINQTGLADLLEIEPISLARLIDRMEQAG